jgi:hypothetical protein
MIAVAVELTVRTVTHVVDGCQAVRITQYDLRHR